MSGSAAWRQLMKRFCGRSTRVRAAGGRRAGGRSSSADGLASRGKMYQTDVMFVARPSAIPFSASSPQNNLANDLTFRSHMPWTELAA